MKKIKEFFELIIPFLVTYNAVALTVCKNALKEMPVAILTPLAKFMIYVIGWEVSCFKNLNYALKN